MTRATLGGIFSGTMEFLKANWLIMIGMIVVLCVVIGVLGYLMLGSFFNQAMTGRTPDPSMMIAMMGRFFLLYMVVFVAMYGACLSVWRHGMTNGQDPVTQNLGWALLGGVMLTLLYIGLMIAIYIVLAIVMLVLIAIVGGSVGMIGSGNISPGAISGPAIALVVVLYIAFLVAALWLMARLSVIGPVMAAQRTVNPITGLAQSWVLTRPSQWLIVGFFVLVTIATIVGFIILGAVLGAIRQPMLMLLAYIPLMLFWWAVPPGIYGQVASPDRGPVFQ